jgi:hypothetical protein
MEERKIMGFSVSKLLSLGAMVAVGIGVLFAILAAVGLGDYASGSAKAAVFFEGILWTLLVSGILLGLSEFLSPRGQ